MSSAPSPAESAQVTAYNKLPLGELSPHMSLVMLDEAGQYIEEIRELLAD